MGEVTSYGRCSKTAVHNKHLQHGGICPQVLERGDGGWAHMQFGQPTKTLEDDHVELDAAAQFEAG